MAARRSWFEPLAELGRIFPSRLLRARAQDRQREHFDRFPRALLIETDAPDQLLRRARAVSLTDAASGKTINHPQTWRGLSLRAELRNEPLKVWPGRWRRIFRGCLERYYGLKFSGRCGLRPRSRMCRHKAAVPKPVLQSIRRSCFSPGACRPDHRPLIDGRFAREHALDAKGFLLRGKPWRVRSMLRTSCNRRSWLENARSITSTAVGRAGRPRAAGNHRDSPLAHSAISTHFREGLSKASST